MDIKIIIAMHKPFQIPAGEDYVPLQVGAAGKDSIGNILRDDEGDNISAKNPYYCELTGLYYAWKNLDAEAIGLVHYRRYFSLKSKKYRKHHGYFDSVLSHDEAKALLTRADVIVPKKRRYYIESLYSHYAHTLDGAHLDIAKEIVGQCYPEYMNSLVKVYARSWGYMFNMAIMPKKELDEYCTWLFDILGRMEEKIDTTSLDAFSARLYGRVSEILFNVWIDKKQEEGLSIVECPVIDMEPINWPKKIMGFLQAKFFGKKYKASM
ncbi:protein of unknown function [Pseudobutyrivibrio sp. C4]|uniref:DUF4422 domain-containing protein n=1 Tax=Pseudobutyrivibrio sp. C4 TaxID=1520803 RepID=UPI0008C7BA03|nr:DUF4422 domain-containing protein [Pseudobutyrivibrio sp. C4]SES85911.1 protein of unknown function [Pseudobutyrivibrio sp. C4]